MVRCFGAGVGGRWRSTGSGWLASFAFTVCGTRRRWDPRRAGRIWSIWPSSCGCRRRLRIRPLRIGVSVQACLGPATRGDRRVRLWEGSPASSRRALEDRGPERHRADDKPSCCGDDDASSNVCDPARRSSVVGRAPALASRVVWATAVDGLRAMRAWRCVVGPRGRCAPESRPCPGALALAGVESPGATADRGATRATCRRSVDPRRPALRITSTSCR